MEDLPLWIPCSPLEAIGAESAVRENLARALTTPATNPKTYIQILKAHPLYRRLFESSSRVYEGYSIEEHTYMVLRQYHRYGNFASQHFSSAEMRLLLLLHDIGKPIPESKHDQVRETLNVIKGTRTLFPVTDSALTILNELLSCDVLGPLAVRSLCKKPTLDEKKAAAYRVLQGEDRFVIAQTLAERSIAFAEDKDIQSIVAETAAKINEHSRRAGIDNEEFLSLLMTYYKSDTVSYTPDAADWEGRRAYPSLDYLFAKSSEFNPHDIESKMFALDITTSGVKFSDMMQRVFGLLTQEVLTKKFV